MRQRRPRPIHDHPTTHERHRTAARRRRHTAPLAAALAVGMLVFGGASAWATPEPAPIPGPATTTLPGTLLEGGYTDAGTTTLFAYAAAGDEVVARLATTDRSPAGARVVVTDPTGTVVYDEAAPAAVGGIHLGGTWTSTLDGVWSIAVHDASPGSGGEASLAWDVGVVRGGASIPGRVWTESLAIHTPDETTIEVVAAAPDGALYRVTLGGYDGVDSTLRMNDVGNAVAGTCEPAGRSVPMPHSPEADGLGAGYWQPSGQDCEGLSAYRLFLDAPAADLPTSTTAWADLRGDDTWLSATYVSPSIEGLSFTRDAATANAGTLAGTLSGQPGVVRVEVDADGDGAFDGAADVADEVAVLDPGAFSWMWDGNDAHGAPVPVSATRVAFRASMAQVSPLHFLRIDAETNVDGIEVDALTGSAPGAATLHWDDSLLDPSSGGRWSRTPQLVSGDAGSPSAGGVHGWAAGGERPNQNDGVGGSWGDLRAIDDWAFLEDGAEATAALAPLADLRIDKRVDAEEPLIVDGSAARVRWTIEVANLGPVPATETVATDLYPAELDVASIAVVSGPTLGTVDAASGVWHIGTLDAGARATLTVEGTVATTTGEAATAVNIATVTSPESPYVPGACQPNDGVEADVDRCDVVETPLLAVAPPTPTPTATPTQVPTPQPPVDRVTEPLPRTGSAIDVALALAAGGVLAAGVAVTVLARRRRTRDS